jgi:E3 ubiquitin-protein ligase BRE1
MIKRAETAESNAQQLDNTVKELKQNNLHFRDAVAAEARAEVDALRSQNAKKDLDLSRLRGQRDDFQAELFERRARDAEKWKFADELQVLANARQERIAALSSEVRRLKGKMAAGAGMEDYYAFLVGVGDAETGYVKEMETKMA